MADQTIFQGFSKKTFKFLKDLEKNNTKDWFGAHRNLFEDEVLVPAQEFVVDMGERLQKISSKIVAIPKTDKSIFRIYRDVRFSKNKTPYKTHIGIFFWEGPRKKLGNPGFYVQLNKSSIFIGGGLHNMPAELFTPYRDAVVDKKRGKALVFAINKIKANPEYKIGGSHYKRVPRGYDPGHPNADLLLYNGVFAYYESKLPDQIYSSDFVDYCYNIFRDMSVLHKWFVSIQSG